MPLNPLRKETLDLTRLNSLAEVAPKLEVLVPKELPHYRFTHPYGTITVYCPVGHITPERVYLLLEQAKHDLLAQHIAAIPNDTEKPK